MPRTSARPKVDSFNFRVDPELKAAFTVATAAEDKPAGQVLRDFCGATWSGGGTAPERPRCGGNLDSLPNVRPTRPATKPR